MKMNINWLAERIEFELFNIAEEDLTKAERNILRIIAPFIKKKKGGLYGK